MNLTSWQRLRWAPSLLAMPAPEPAQQQAARILTVQRKFVLPARAIVTAVALYYLFYLRMLGETPLPVGLQGRVFEVLRYYVLGYAVINAVAAFRLFFRRISPGAIQWVAFSLGLLDGLLLAGMTLETGGFSSYLFWVFPGLIILNAVSIPLATPQIVLNLMLGIFYLGAGLANTGTGDLSTGPLPHKVAGKPLPVMSVPQILEPVEPDPGTEPFILRLIILWLITFSCYGIQLLAFRQRLAEQEAQEAAARNSELKTAGRLAAEIAHQLKNPLGIINNAAYSLQRGLREGRPVSQQLEIIREEVERSDRIITQLMGYAQLSEGRVEKLNVAEELDRIVAEVFPPAASYTTQVHRDYGDNLPPLMMQRAHLSAALVNLLQNSREALLGQGNLRLSAHARGDHAVEIIIADDGPGIPPDKLVRIFEAYFTTKEKGTGLGLAIVKHNVELYGGKVSVESKLGKGARFVLLFSTRTFVK